MAELVQQKSRSLREGIISLAAVQGAEYLIPLLALPYLLRVLGAADYGKIAFAQAFGMYFVILTEYGFSLTGTRQIAIHRHDKHVMSRIFWEIQLIKVLFFTLSAAILAVLVACFAKLSDVSAVLFVGLLPVLGCVVYPLWVLQGLERMREAAAMMITARVLMLACVLTFVKGPDDLLLAAALQFGAMPLAGLMSWFMLARGGQLKWVTPTPEGVLQHIRESWHTFLATAASTLYRSSNAVILGLMTGPTSVAYYSLAEKLVKAAQEVNRPISQAVYPRISALAAQSKDAVMPLLRKVVLGIGGVSFMASAVLFIFAEPIIHLIAGPGFGHAVTTLRFMAFVPLVGSLNTVLGTQTLLPFGFSKYFSRFVLMAGILNLILIAPLVIWLSDSGAALSFFLSESLLMVSMYWFLRRRGITYF